MRKDSSLRHTLAMHLIFLSLIFIILKSVLIDAQSPLHNNWSSIFKSRDIYINLELASLDK